jgi:hypothetical protein
MASVKRGTPVRASTRRSSSSGQVEVGGLLLERSPDRLRVEVVEVGQEVVGLIASTPTSSAT